MTASDLLHFHDAVYARILPSLQKTADAGLIAGYDSLTYPIHGLISVAESTQDPARISRVTDLLDRCAGAAKDLDGDGYREWGPLDANGNPVQHFHFKTGAAVARAVDVILSSPALRASVPQAKVQGYAKLAREVSVGRWIEHEYGGKVPWLSTSNGGWGTYTLWQDRTGHLGALVSHLAHATQEPLMSDLAVKITTDFRQKIVDDGKGGAVWDLGVPLSVWQQQSFQNAHNAQDTSHSNSEPKMMVAAYECGVSGVTREILGRIAAHVLSVMWNGSLTKPSVANYIDGDDSAFLTVTAPGGIGNIYAGWVMLGRYYAGIQTLGESILSAFTQGVINPCIAYNTSDVGQLCLSGHLYRNQTIDAVPIPAPVPSSPSTLPVAGPRTEVTRGGEIKTLVVPAGVQMVSLLAVGKPFTLSGGGNIHAGMGSAARSVPVGSAVVLFNDGKEWIPL